MKGQSSCDFVLDTRALLQGKKENFFCSAGCSQGAGREGAEVVLSTGTCFVRDIDGRCSDAHFRNQRHSEKDRVGMAWLVCSSCKVLLFLWVESNKE